MKPSTSEFSQLVNEIARLYEGLETLTYFEYLELDRSADYVAVRDAFYDRAQRFHPDRFLGTRGAMVKKAVYTVYKRMTEAYNVLADPNLRYEYEQALEAGENRLASESRSRRPSAEERLISNPFARCYARSARDKLARHDAFGAFVDIELARSLEDSEALDALHAEIARAVGPSAGGERV
jgi:DnaJ-class molecular chaperone